MHHTETITIETTVATDIVDITARVEGAVCESGVTNGIATIFVPGSTASVTTIEYESGVVEDLREAIERVAPSGKRYRHDDRWGDGNGYSHVRAAMMKPGITVPVVEGTMTLGTWQQIVVMDFDNRPRTRTVVVHITGDRDDG